MVLEVVTFDNYLMVLGVVTYDIYLFNGPWSCYIWQLFI